MRIQIRSKTADLLDKTERDEIERGVRLALTRYERYIARVVVTLTAVTKGWKSWRRREAIGCVVRVSGRPGWRVIIRERDVTALAACRSALARTARAVARRLEVARRRDSSLRRRPSYWRLLDRLRATGARRVGRGGA